MKKIAFLFLIFFCLPAFAQDSDYSWQPEFEAYVDGLMKEYKIPGIAIQVVNENGPVMQITKGVRDAKKNLPVTANTLFAIGSTSKAFTGLMLAQLSEQGKISFDNPVSSYLPDFYFGSEELTRILTLRDLMGHWTGAGRHDLAWYHRDGLKREMVLELTRNLGVSAKPRTDFIYNNYMWTIAGIAAERVAGKSWELLLKENIFDQIQMFSSNSSTAATLASNDYSLPYVSGEAGFQEVPFYDIAPFNPAGGIYSNLNDMAKWLQFHLNRGRVGDKQILAESFLDETYKPYSAFPGNVGKYGMGWGMVDFAGSKLLTHDGGIDGFSSNVSFMPQKKMGIVILTGSGDVIPQHLALRLWQHLLGAKEIKDWARASIEQGKVAAEENKRKYPEFAEVDLDRAAAKFAGEYCNPLYGKAFVSVSAAGKVQINLNAIFTELYTYAPLKFAIKGHYSAMKYLEFSENEAGLVNGFSWKLEPTSAQAEEFSRCGG